MKTLSQKSRTKYRIKVSKLKTRKYINFNNILKGPLFDKVCLHAKLLWLCPTLCDPMNCRPQGSSVLERQEYRNELPCPFPDLPNPETEPASLMSPTLGGSFYSTITTSEALDNMYSVFLVFEIYHFKIKILQTMFFITVIFSLIMSLTLVDLSKLGIIIPIFTYGKLGLDVNKITGNWLG